MQIIVVNLQIGTIVIHLQKHNLYFFDNDGRLGG
jgi:hypothetical protein